MYMCIMTMQVIQLYNTSNQYVHDNEDIAMHQTYKSM